MCSNIEKTSPHSYTEPKALFLPISIAFAMIYYVKTFVNHVFSEYKQRISTYIVDSYKKLKKSLAFAKIRAIILDVHSCAGLPAQILS